MGNIIASNTNNVASFDGSGTSLSFKKPVSGTDATFTGKITYNNMEGTTVKGTTVQGTTGNFGTVNVDAGGDVKIGTASLNSRITALETSSATTSSAISSGNFNTGTFSGLLTANGGLTVGGVTNKKNLTLWGDTTSYGVYTSTKGINVANQTLKVDETTGVEVNGNATLNKNLTTLGTGTFAGDLNANGGLSGTTGTFSGALNANGGLSGTTGTFSGVLNASGGLNVPVVNQPGIFNHIGYGDGKNYLRGETVIQLGNLNVETEGYFAKSIKAGFSAAVPVITKGTGTTASTIPSVPQNGLLLGSGDNPWSLAEVKPSATSTNNRLCFIKGTQVFACLDTTGNLQAANDPAWT